VKAQALYSADVQDRQISFHNIKNRFVMYLLSSSIAPCDEKKAAENKYIKDFLTKLQKKKWLSRKRV